MGFIPVQLSSVSLNFPYFDKKDVREGILVARTPHSPNRATHVLACRCQTVAESLKTGVGDVSLVC